MPKEKPFVSIADQLRLCEEGQSFLTPHRSKTVTAHARRLRKTDEMIVEVKTAQFITVPMFSPEGKPCEVLTKVTVTFKFKTNDQS